jgi:hypothetical protein
MKTSNKTPLVIAFIIVILLFLIFGGTVAGSMMGGGMMGPDEIGGYRMGRGWISGGSSWLWISTLLTLALGVLLGWMIVAKK